MKGFFRAGWSLCLPLLVVPQHSRAHTALVPSAPAVWGCSEGDGLGNQTSLHVKYHFPERETNQGRQRSMCRLPSATQPPWGPAHFASPAVGSGRHLHSGWLRQSNRILMVFPAARGVFGGIKDGCGRVESNLQTSLALSALRCSCLHAGGTAACSEACLERGQE